MNGLATQSVEGQESIYEATAFKLRVITLKGSDSEIPVQIETGLVTIPLFLRGRAIFQQDGG